MNAYSFSAVVNTEIGKLRLDLWRSPDGEYFVEEAYFADTGASFDPHEVALRDGKGGWCSLADYYADQGSDFDYGR